MIRLRRNLIALVISISAIGASGAVQLPLGLAIFISAAAYRIAGNRRR